MARMLVLGAALVLISLLQGCTIHFKATELELDAERQRVEENCTYRLDSVDLFGGEYRQS